MATRETFYMGKKSVTSGGKVHKPNKVVTAKIMGLSDEAFANEVKRGAVKTGTPPDAKSPAAPPAPPVVLRIDRINNAIKALFAEDGSRLSDEDFTQGGSPTCDALNATALMPNEDFIDSAERDEAWEKYQAEKAAE